MVLVLLLVGWAGAGYPPEHQKRTSTTSEPHPISILRSTMPFFCSDGCVVRSIERIFVWWESEWMREGKMNVKEDSINHKQTIRANSFFFFHFWFISFQIRNIHIFSHFCLLLSLFFLFLLISFLGNLQMHYNYVSYFSWIRPLGASISALVFFFSFVDIRWWWWMGTWRWLRTVWAMGKIGIWKQPVALIRIGRCIHYYKRLEHPFLDHFGWWDTCDNEVRSDRCGSEY